jgi:hypothetical protein
MDGPQKPLAIKFDSKETIKTTRNFIVVWQLVKMSCRIQELDPRNVTLIFSYNFGKISVPGNCPKVYLYIVKAKKTKP